MSATSTVATVGTAFGHKLLTMKMRRTLTSITATAINFYIIYKILIHKGCSSYKSH